VSIRDLLDRLNSAAEAKSPPAAAPPSGGKPAEPFQSPAAPESRAQELSPLGHCVEAFMRRDYETCASRAKALLDQSVTFDAAQMLVICLMRLGKKDEAFLWAGNMALHENLVGNRWEQTMLLLSAGKGDPVELAKEIPKTSDDAAARKAWQINYYYGSVLMAMKQFESAREIFLNAMLGTKPISCLECALMAIDNNFLVSGSSGGEVDKPVEALNLETQKLSGRDDAHGAMSAANRAFDLAQKTLGKDHPAYVTALHNVGASALTIGDYALATRRLQELVDLQRFRLGDRHEIVGQMLNLLAVAHERSGEKKKAAECYQEALEILDVGVKSE
jgi:tetratricopeptide (TPR) repeat protein